MPLTLTDEAAVLAGHITVEEAEPLARWLRETDEPAVDLGDCTHLHTAALQALLAARPTILAAPAEAFLATWIAPLLPDPSPAAVPAAA
jgi:hypothetical protein